MKKQIIFVIGFFFLGIKLSIGQVIDWQNTIGGSSWDYLTSMQQTSDGGYILGGYSASPVSGDKTETNADVDYWIVKTDSLSNIQWQNTIGGNSEDALFTMQQTSDGGYILGGLSISNISGDKTENCIGGWDYWIVKTDASGNIQWENTIGGSNYDRLSSIQQTADGGYIMGGYSSSSISGDKTENGYGDYDYWIVKTDAAGNIQWDNTIGGNSRDWLNSLQQTSDGGYILGGWSLSDISGDKTENSNGYSDYWIVKTDASGNIQWQNTMGGSNYDELTSIQQTSDGGYIMNGQSVSDISGDKTENSWNNSYDGWIVKTDASGNIQWQNTIGGSAEDGFSSVLQTADGGYIIGGSSFSGISGDKTENNGDLAMSSTDYWIVKTDASGNIRWQNTIGGSLNDRPSAIQEISDGEYILGGWSDSNISGDKTENSNGSADYWIVKVTENYNLITGKLFVDANSNNVKDVGEHAVQNRTLTEINTGRFAYSEQNGNYSASVLDSGNYTVTPAGLSYYNPVPATHDAYFSGIQQTDNLNDFAFQPLGVFNDLCVSITPIGPFRSWFNASYMITYENVGTTTLNGTVIFFPDDDVTFVSSNVTPTSVTTDSVVWNLGTLTPFQTGSILVTVHVTAGTPVGTLINSNVRIEPVAGDNYPGCNYAYWEVYTTASFDPNAILVDRDTVLTTELSSPPYLNYIVYFQNTGNDTAFNVKILNPIDTFNLQLNTLEFIASSHPVNMNWIPWSRNMEFTFDNILLPDSNVNEPGSHGFVRYRIKPKSTLAAGDLINNIAYIYFDFNQPVQTNTAVTEIVLPTSLTPGPSPKEKGVALAPNPVTDELTVSFSPPLRGGLVDLVVFDLFGREVFQLQTSNLKSQTKINVSGFSKGVYFIEMRSGEKALRAKFVKQ